MVSVSWLQGPMWGYLYARGDLAFDSMNPDDPSTLSIYSMYTTWLSWSLWARGLSIVSPIALLLIGSRFDNSSRFGKLPSGKED